jgi:hypothetical protein
MRKLLNGFLKAEVLPANMNLKRHSNITTGTEVENEDSCLQKRKRKLNGSE